MAKNRALMQMYRERISEVPLFSGLSVREVRSLAQRSRELTFPAEKTIVVEGARGVEFFVLLSGKANVTRRGRTVGTLGPGDSFGELALIAGTARQATVTTTEPCELMVLMRPDFLALLDEFPNMTRKMLTALATWVAAQGD